MIELYFDEPQEFEDLFTVTNPKITNGIFDGIKEAFHAKKDIADLFRIYFGPDEDTDYYEISLDDTQWAQALDTCLKKYEEMEMFDDALDVYVFRKEFYTKYGPQ